MRMHRLPPVVTGVILNPLALSPATLPEHSTAGTVVGALGNLTTGSTLLLTVDAGTRFALSGTNIVAGATQTDFATATSHSITVRETKAGALNTPNDTVIIVSVTNVTGGLSTPTLSLSSAAGAVPMILQGSDADYVAGYRGQLQIATDSGFSSIAQNRIFFIDGSSWASNSVSTGVVTPSGTYFARWRVAKDNAAGATTVSGTDIGGNSVSFPADVSLWSNTVTDTISVSSALLSSSNGASKSHFINVATPFHQGISNAVVGSPCCVRSSIAMAVAKGHFEFNIDGLASTGGVNCGITDAATLDFNATGFNGTRPGSGSNIPGVTVKTSSGGTTLAIYSNGGVTSPSIPGGVAPAQGDAIIFEVDAVANTVAIYWYRLATTTSTLVTTITMSGLYIPAAIWAFGGTEKGTGALTTFGTSDAFTFNPGYATFLRTATAGFSPYG